MEDNGILVEYAYSFLRLIFNTAQLGFYHCTLYHCKNVQCYPPILGPGYNSTVLSLFIAEHSIAVAVVLVLITLTATLCVVSILVVTLIKKTRPKA